MVWEYFNDGRPFKWHTHPIKKIEGVRPRPPGPLARLVTRREWKANSWTMHYDDKLVFMKHPVHTVRITYTDTWVPETPEECKKLTWQLQENHMSKYTYDIMWNFLIAPDGKVYEGRGWDMDACRPVKYKKLEGHCVDIAYMGNYIAKPVPDIMLEALHDLVDWGVYNGKIQCCHDVIPLTDPQVDDGFVEDIRRQREKDELDDYDYVDIPE